MASVLDDLRVQITAMRAEVEKELAASRERLRYTLKRGRATFDRDTKREHRGLRLGLARFFRDARLSVALTAPIIYSLIVPFVLLDLFVTVFQAVCFPIYGIAKVKRADHIVIDRQLLAYLNPMEKLNCVYCSYGNGLISYVREIAALTEKYWCPIKHSRISADPHELHADFLDYGDAQGWRDHQDRQSKQQRSPPKPPKK